MKNTDKHFRVVKVESLLLNGALHIRFYPEYKGWFGWSRFSKDNEFGCSIEACFEKFEDAKAFLNNVIRLDGFSRMSIVEEYIATK